MTRSRRSVLAIWTCMATVSCLGMEPEDEDFDETAVEWVTCGGRVPDRTASTVSALPFQTLDRATVPSATASIAWTWPTTANVMANNFGAGRSYNEGHEGADLGGRRGDVIRAAAAGRVVYALSSCPDNDVRRDITCGNGWGNHVVIDHGSGVFTRYAHLQRLAVAVDATVVAGQTLGTMGHSGLSDGPHLHFELGSRAPLRALRRAAELRQGVQPRAPALRRRRHDLSPAAVVPGARRRGQRAGRAQRDRPAHAQPGRVDERVPRGGDLVLGALPHRRARLGRRRVARLDERGGALLHAVSGWRG
ncbi:MAG: M23 family metallopeptidase [Polyangiales bacterium]